MRIIAKAEKHSKLQDANWLKAEEKEKNKIVLFKKELLY